MRRATKTIILIAVLSVSNSLTGVQGIKPTYDGQWWLSRPAQEQEGFIAGYYDCYTYEYKGPDGYKARSFKDYGSIVTEYYKQDSSHKTEPVDRVLHRFRDAKKARVASGTRDRHAYFDGLYWKQASAVGGTDKQVGFIEGYLSCHSKLSHNAGGVFQKSAKEYSRLVTKWYGLNEQTGDIDEKREVTKIADVLYKVRGDPE